MDYQIHKTQGDTEWFRKDRFGMFIHWGLYSLPARHEWIKSYEKITEEKYQKYFDKFHPDLFDPKEWARQAKAAGMKYAVLTTKHHDGFCLFDTKFTDYKATNTAAGRDLVREYVDAFRAEGLKVGFYYSLIDWHHPSFPLDIHHPRRDDPDAFAQNENRDMTVYAKYMRDQVGELLSNYGKIDILWFDFSYSGDAGKYPPCPWMKGKGKNDWEAESLIALARTLQPGIIIDNRTELEQDIWTPEQYQPQSWLRHPETNELVTWEACQTFSGAWGYHRDESSWKSPEMLLELLINTVSLGGNLLMNVGPTARGYLDARAEYALSVYANWMKYNSRAIYDCTMAEARFHAPNGCKLTQSNDGKRLYVHLLSYPYHFLELQGFAGLVDYAQFVHDDSEILFDENKVVHFGEGMTVSDNMLVLNLPTVKPPVLFPVIELILK